MDYAQDFKGSFIPDDPTEVLDTMKDILQTEITRIFNDYDQNFLCHGLTGDLTVKKGEQLPSFLLPVQCSRR